MRTIVLRVMGILLVTLLPTAIASAQVTVFTGNVPMGPRPIEPCAPPTGELKKQIDAYRAAGAYVWGAPEMGQDPVLRGFSNVTKDQVYEFVMGPVPGKSYTAEQRQLLEISRIAMEKATFQMLYHESEKTYKPDDPNRIPAADHARLVDSFRPENIKEGFAKCWSVLHNMSYGTEHKLKADGTIDVVTVNTMFKPVIIAGKERGIKDQNGNEGIRGFIGANFTPTEGPHAGVTFTPFIPRVCANLNFVVVAPETTGQETQVVAKMPPPDKPAIKIPMPEDLPPDEDKISVGVGTAKKAGIGGAIIAAVVCAIVCRGGDDDKIDDKEEPIKPVPPNATRPQSDSGGGGGGYGIRRDTQTAVHRLVHSRGAIQGRFVVSRDLIYVRLKSWTF